MYNLQKCVQVLFSYVAVAIFPAHADVDLSKIDRTIGKEPAYKSKDVKYCLLVFGPEAKTRVWLVQDGDTLYVDRNANGDLTEAGERISATTGPDTDAEEGTYLFECEDIQEGGLTHKKLRLQVYKRSPSTARDELEKLHIAKNPSVRFYSIRVDVHMLGYVGNGLGGRVEYGLSHRDRKGILDFASTPTAAPVIHLGGPWQVMLYPNEGLKISRESDVALIFGTLGFGPGTTAMVAYEKLVPENAHPKIEITYPPAKDGDARLKEVHELRERC